MAVSGKDIEAGRAFVRLFLKNEMGKQLSRVLKSASDRLRKFGRSATMAGMRMAATGAAIASPIVLGMREFANFDAKIGDVSTMLDNPDDFMPGFRQGIKDMAVDFGKTKEDLATGLYDILSATVPPERAMERLSAATKLAAAGNAEVGDSVSVLNTLMDTYGDSFRDAGDAADFLFGIVKRGRTNLPELAGSLGNIIAIAKSAGMSVEDMGASVALLTRATGKTDSAMTALQAISGTFLKPGIEGAALWKQKFGDAMDASTLKTLGMAGVLERLSTLKADEVAKIFPNMRAIRGIFPALAKMKGFGDDIKAMSDRGGNVATAFEKIKGPLFFWKQGLEQGKNILLEIGRAVTDALVPHLKTIMAIGKSVETWIKNNKALVVTVAAVAAGLVVAGTTLMGVGIAATLASVALGGLATVASVVLSPLGLITGALVGGVAAWMRYSESGKRAFASLKAGIMPIVDTLKSAFGGVIDAMKSGDWELAGKIAMAGLKLAILQGLGVIRSAFPKTFDGILHIVGKVGDGIVMVWSKVTGFLTSQWNAWGKKTVETVLFAASHVTQIWQKAVQGMANWMLEQSAKGGIMGKAMSKVLGVDMAAEEARSAKLDRELGLGPTDVLADARKAVEDYTQTLVDNVAAIGGEPGTGSVSESLDAFLSKLESGTGIEDAAKELAALRAAAAKQKEQAAKGSTQSGGAPGAGTAETVGLGAPAATAAVPTGVGLTATYSAAAARIAGYQPGGGGPEERTAAGVESVVEQAKEMASNLAALLGQGQINQALLERFLAGWRVG